MTTPSFLQPIAATLAGLVFASGAFAANPNPFFAMDTALRDGQARPPADQAALVKELGYDGFGTSGYPSTDFLAAFEKQGLKVFNTYITLDLDSAKPDLDPKLKEAVARLKGHGTDLWIALNGVTKDGVKLKPSDPAGDAVVVPPMRELAELAKASDVRVAFYPHTGFWLERAEDAVHVARAVDRPNVGATFNLCHWLKVEGDRDPRPVLKDALPKLFFVTINGADGGDTKALNWDKLIQPLDAGSYDVAGLVKSLRELGYRGPIGFQGYGIPGDSREILRRTMGAWRRMSPR
jgi:sugar phosphate isomerase/epimerase